MFVNYSSVITGIGYRLVVINNDSQDRSLNTKLFNDSIYSKKVNYEILFGLDEVSINDDNINIKSKSSAIILIK